MADDGALGLYTVSIYLPDNKTKEYITIPNESIREFYFMEDMFSFKRRG